MSAEPSSGQSRVWAAAALVASLIVLAQVGCGDSSRQPTPAPTPVPTPTPINPQAILDMCGAAMAALNSFRFHIGHDDDGGTPLPQGMTLREASGGVVNPDRLALEFSGVSGSFSVKGSLIAIGEDVYMTNPLSGEWHAVSSAISPLEFFDPTQGIAGILAQVRDATLISRDADAYRIGGKLSATALAPLFGDTAGDSDVDVVLEIDSTRFYLTQARLEGRVTPTEAPGLVRLITLSEFDEPIEIALPDAGGG